METFIQVFGFIAALCAGIIILALFFTGLNYLKRATRGFDIVKMKRFIKDGRLVNVHLSSGKIFAGVRFIGFTDESSTKGDIPYPLSHMVVCETAKGTRVFFRADAVRIIEELEDAS
jgi:hypothetical protein